jgi:hypothetical protein
VGLSSQSVTLVERGRFVFLDVPSGVTLGDCTMREPKLRNLKVDVAETAKIRRSLKKQKSVKITINLDADSFRGSVSAIT